MGETMYSAHGIGLAAPQVGESIRLFVADTQYSRDEDGAVANRHLKVFINPEITWESVEDEPYTEGCLSIPGLEGDVYRPISVKMRYLDEKGVQHERLLEGLEARCAQHELDHLDGVMFIDRMPPLRRRLLAGKLNNLKKNAVASVE
jgi:peptide deformylase